MACAITEPGNYPDYIKKMLKEINVGNDDKAKACACSLRTPTTDEGCPITDEDGKVGIFPFCVINTDIDPTSELDEDGFPIYVFAFTLKELMELWWGVYRYKISANTKHTYEDCGLTTTFIQTASGSSLRDSMSVKDFFKIRCSQNPGETLFSSYEFTTNGESFNLDCDTTVNTFTSLAGFHLFSSPQATVYFYENKFYIYAYYTIQLTGLPNWAVHGLDEDQPTGKVGTFTLGNLNTDILGYTGGGATFISTCVLTKGAKKS